MPSRVHRYPSRQPVSTISSGAAASAVSHLLVRGLQRRRNGWEGELLTARHALNASVVWCGSRAHVPDRAFPARVRGAGRCCYPAAPRPDRSWDCLLVTGLDLIPNARVLICSMRVPPADMEAWSWGGDQVTSWADALLWVPHHVGAVVAGLTGFLLIWHAARSLARTWRRKDRSTPLIAGVAFATSSWLLRLRRSGPGRGTGGVDAADT
jgi:hypothetical protein